MTFEDLRIISDRDELLRLGVCKVPIPEAIAEKRRKWSSQLTQVTPMILASEGDGEYAFYRNILQEPELEFPLDLILKSEIGTAILNHFGLSSLDEIRLDDAFCISYNTSQSDTSGAKHTDPSEITVNMCIEKTDDVQGSQVLFYGTKRLENIETKNESSNSRSEQKDFRFLVTQEEAWCTIHYGSHPHETMPLESGQRTNIVLTYCYVDESKSDAGKRTCYVD
jgi:hypothetical protein